MLLSGLESILLFALPVPPVLSLLLLLPKPKKPLIPPDFLEGESFSPYTLTDLLSDTLLLSLKLFTLSFVSVVSVVSVLFLFFFDEPLPIFEAN